MRTIIAVLCAFSCLSAVLAQIPSAAVMKQIKENIDFCVKERNATPADVNTYTKKQIPNTKSAQCFFACMYKKSGIMDDSQKLNADKTKQMFKSMQLPANILEKMNKVIDECKQNETPASDECEAAKNIKVCLSNGAMKAGIPASG